MYVAGDMLKDAQRHADLMCDIDLEWGVVRPPRRTNDPYSGDWRAGDLRLGPTAERARADLAECMVRQVESDEWIGESPMVAN